MLPRILLIFATLVDVERIPRSVSSARLATIDKPSYDTWSWLLDSLRVRSPAVGRKEYTVCRTNACRRTADMILKNMNKSVNPCTDFYEYTCGGWRARETIPPSESTWDQFKRLQSRTNDQIRAILEEPKKAKDILPVKAAKQLYRACMNLDAIEKQGISPIEAILNENGGWPIAMAGDEWNPNGLSWQQIDDNYTRLLDESSLYSFTVGTDFQNASINVLMLDQPDFSLPRSMLVDRKQFGTQIAKYARYIEQVALAFAESRGSDVSRENVARDVADIVNFEIELAKISSPDEMRRNIERMYNPMTIYALQKWYDGAGPCTAVAKINWLKVTQNIFNEVKIKIEMTEKIILVEMDYIFKLASILSKTPTRTIVNYIHWRLASSLIPFTNKQMRDVTFEVEKSLFGIKEPYPRWRTCITENEMSHAVSYQYVRKHFPEEAKETAMELVKEIEEEFAVQISQSDWMDEATKKAAKDKLRGMMRFIGYPDWYKNKTAALHYYKGMRAGPVYFDNVVNTKKYQLKKELLRLRRPADKTEWITPPITINAFYNPSANSLTFPAAILQVPFFSSAQPDSVNYGAIGTVIGHEISHGFDDIGRQFDRNGNVLQWWSDPTIKAYNKRAACFVNQFNDYLIKELEALNGTAKANGELTEGENIADTTGLQAVYQVYQTRLKKKGGQEPRLPGLEEFDSNQLFFLSFANTWCESVRPEYLLYSVKSDEHSTGRLRVIGSVSNEESFSAAFHCPLKSKMNPKIKCNLWK